MIPKGVMLVVVAAAAAMALGGCREAEQNRLLSYEKGTYLGKPDDPVSAQLQDERRQRLRRYWSAGYASLGGGSPPNVRPPESGGSSARNRVLKQNDQ